MEKKGSVKVGFIKNVIRKWVNSDMSLIGSNTKDCFYNQDINTWYQLYDDERVLGKGKGMNLPKSIITETCKTAIHEFNFNVETANKDLAYAGKFLQKNLTLLATHLTVGGSVALKPYISENRVGMVVVPATNFIAKFDSFGDLESVRFKSVIEEDNKVFTLVENHTFEKLNKKYRIEYELYKSSSYGNSGDWGSKVPLSECSETAGLDDFVVFEEVEKHLCVVKTLGNTQYFNVGQAIFAPALELIADANSQYDRVCWEYEGSQLMVQANAELFHKPGSSIKNDNYTLPQGKERLYVALPGADNDFTVETYAPTLRDSGYWSGLNNMLRRIEFACGLSYGVLSESQEQAKTATEISASKQRYYITISNIRNVMCECIDEIIEKVAFISSRLNNSLQDNSYTLTYSIEDGILTTTKEKIEEKLLLVEKGLMSAEQFNEWYTSKQNK